MRKLVLIATLCAAHFLGAQSVKGLYVNQFASILGNTQAEDSLLDFAAGNSYTYLALYELHFVHAQHDLTNFTASAPLAAFINKAKTQYGIQQVGAIAENYWFFQNRIHIYNQQHPNADEQFDVFNLEFEFWISSAVGPAGYYCNTYLTPNGFSCDTAGGFDFYISELHKIDSLAATEGHISETYIGWPTEGQCHEINATCDRVLLHAYVTSMNAAYGYVQTRLSYFGTAADSANIIIIFSAEPAFMGPWLTTNPEYGTWTQFNWDYSQETASWTNNINLIGYQWFAYTFMPYELFTNVESDSEENNWKLYFTQSTLNVMSDKISSRVYTVYDATGTIVCEYEANSGGIGLDFHGKPSGLYIVSVTDLTNGETYTGKIIFTHE